MNNQFQINLPNLNEYKQEFKKQGIVTPLPVVPFSKTGLLAELPSPPPQKTGWPWTEEVNPNVYENKANWPKFSVITPSFNQGCFIEETIRSVLLQNYPNAEYMIMDGGSSDESLEIIKKYEKWLSFSTSEKDRGQAHAINRGLSILDGKYWQWINSDDYYFPDIFKKSIETLEESECDTLYAGVFESTDDEKISYYYFSFNVTKEAIINPYSIFNKDFYYKPEATILSVDCSKLAKGVREDFHNMFDTDFMTRYSQYAKPIYKDIVIMRYRIHPLTKTIASARRIYEEYFKMLGEYHLLGTKYWFPVILKKAGFISTREQSDCKNRVELLMLAFRLLSSYPYVVISKAYWGLWRRIIFN